MKTELSKKMRGYDTFVSGVNQVSKPRAVFMFLLLREPERAESRRRFLVLLRTAFCLLFGRFVKGEWSWPAEYPLLLLILLGLLEFFIPLFLVSSYENTDILLSGFSSICAKCYSYFLYNSNYLAFCIKETEEGVFRGGVGFFGYEGGFCSFLAKI